MSVATQKVLRNIIIGGIFLIPFIPFIVPDSMFFPFITGKNFAFRVLVELLVGAWIFLAIVDPEYRPRFRTRGADGSERPAWILIAISAFVGIMLVAALLGENVTKSIWSNYERMEGWITLIHLLGFFLVTTSVLQTEKLWHRLFQVSLGASVIMGIYGLYQLGGVLEIHQGGVRLDGTFGNATYLAVYALIHTFLAVFLAIRTKAGAYMWSMYGVVALLNLVMLYNTATRGAILGMIGGALLVTLLIALFGKQEHPQLRKWAIGGIGFVVLLVGGFWLAKDTSVVQDSAVMSRFANISFDSGTVQSRFTIWEMALEGFQEHPIIGWGQGNFGLLFNKYYKSSLYNQEPFFDRAHNVFLDWLTAGGVLGLTAYLSIFVAILYILWRRVRALSFLEKSIITGLLVAYFFHNIFVFDNLMSYVLFMMLAGYVHVRSLAGTERGIGGEHTPRASVMQVSGAVLVILTIAIVYQVNAKPLLANRGIIQGFAQLQQNGPHASQESFERAIGYGTYGTPEAREHFVQTAQRVVGAQQIPEQARQEYAGAAFEQMEQQVSETPNDARYRLILASFAGTIRQYEKAVEEFNTAIDLSPGKQAIYIGLAQLHANNQKYEKALSVAQEGYELYTDNPNARDAYAATAIQVGNYALAEELLIPAYGTIVVPDDQFVRAFSVQEDYENIIKIWKKRIAEMQKEGRDNAQFHISLAASYLNNGDRQLAIDELEKAMELNPDFTDQGQYYIDEIKAGRTP